jgi:hypothetical protein
MACVVTVKTHHPHDGCAEGTANHVRGNPSAPGGPLGSRMRIPKSSAGVKAPDTMPKLKGNPGKVEKTMHEFKKGALHSGSKRGPKVTSRKQAVAIALSQARKAGEDVAPKSKKR